MATRENPNISEQDKTAPQSIDKVTQKGPKKEAPPREPEREIKVDSAKGTNPQSRNPHETK